MVPLKLLPATPFSAVVVSARPLGAGAGVGFGVGVGAGEGVVPVPPPLTLTPLRLVSSALTLGVPQPVGVS